MNARGGESRASRVSHDEASREARAMASSSPDSLQRHLPSLAFVVVVAIVLVLGLEAFVVSGVYKYCA